MRIFQREQRSLFGEILDWMLVPLLVIWPMSVVLTYIVAQDIAKRPFDRALEQNVRTLAHLVQIQEGGAQLNLPRPAREILRSDETDETYYQIRSLRGDVLGGERGLPLPNGRREEQSLGEVRVRDDVGFNNDIRVAYMWTNFGGKIEAPVLIQVAETLEKRKLLATEIIKGVMIPQFFILPLALLLVWVALSRSIRPLSELEQTIRARKSEDLSPLNDEFVPQEVAPLVASVNDLLSRLKLSIHTQKRFLADAAHQLKTPLAGLRMQADLALRESSKPEDLKKSLSQIGRSSVRATHTVNQLLSLARAESALGAQQMVQCNLVEIAKEVVQDVLPHVLDKSISLGFEAPDNVAACTLRGNPTMLKELVRNLVDNAINYSSVGGEVNLRVLADLFGKILVLQVEDNGPGVSAHEQEAIFQPFYRSLGSQADGSGLGLSIVQEVAAQHGAQVQLDSPTVLSPVRLGSRFSVRFALS